MSAPLILQCFSHIRKLVISSVGMSFWCVSLLLFLPFCVCLVFLRLFVISSSTVYYQPLVYGVFSFLWWRVYVCIFILPKDLTVSFVGLPIPLFCLPCQMSVSHCSISQSKCLRVIGNFPRRTPIPRLHTTLNVTPIRDFIYHLTASFFDRCSAHPNPLVFSIGNYSLADLHHQYKKYVHKRPKHILF